MEQTDGRKTRVLNSSLDYHKKPELVEVTRTTTFLPRWKITASGERKMLGRPSVIFHLRLRSPPCFLLACKHFSRLFRSIPESNPTEDLSSRFFRRNFAAFLTRDGD